MPQMTNRKIMCHIVHTMCHIVHLTFVRQSKAFYDHKPAIFTKTLIIFASCFIR